MFNKFLRHIVKLVSMLFAFMLSKRKISHLTCDRINLGSGLFVAPEWCNIDCSFNLLIARMPAFVMKRFYRLSGSSAYYSTEEYVSILKNNFFIFHDLKYGIPLKDESVTYIYSSHFLEHLSKEDCYSLLSEAYRVLKREGIIRISVPDLGYALELYPKYPEKMLDKYFFSHESEGYYARHRYMYDYKMLYRILKGLGFKKIKRCDYRVGSVPDLKILDNRPEESLFVEAYK